MDPKNTAEMMKHLEKQTELLQDAHKKMSHELHRLQNVANIVAFNEENQESNPLEDILSHQGQ